MSQRQAQPIDLPSAAENASALAVLERLPAALGWAVMFRSSTVLTLIDRELAPQVFSLPPEAAVADSAFIVLTSAGRGLAGRDGATTWHSGTLPRGGSLAERWAGRLALMPDIATADCVGIGALPGEPPVVLALTVEDGIAAAEAIFERAPDERNYELLAAAGVRYRGGEPAGPHWRARFTNDLPQHLLAAALSGFARTGHCNRFFLQHGVIDAPLAAGLVAAVQSRIEEARRRMLTLVLRQALAARRSALAMTCLPPAPDIAFPYGDVVPLGFLLAAIERSGIEDEKLAAGAALLRRQLEKLRCGTLWPFHRERLPTATDSALVLLGHRGAAEIEALERFNDGSGRYLPQLDAAERDGEHMRRSAAVDHWCQGDLGTTCLVRALRAEAGLPQRTPIALLEEPFAERGALFFANPYLMDWALALALRGDAGGAALRAKLGREIRASANADGSFGRYDQALSTALAILALAALGISGRPLLLAQLRLAQLLAEAGLGPPPTPFYSTERLADAAGAIRGRGILRVGEGWYALSLYEDGYRMILAALAAEALSVATDDAPETPAAAEEPHPRYRAPSAEAYVAGFALPPYVRGRR
jgi:hypothetical protein